MKRVLAVTGGAFLIGLLTLLALGSLRYGGLDGLALRVRAEIAAQRPRPLHVPTSLPTVTGRATSATTSMASSTPTATSTSPATAITGATAPVSATVQSASVGATPTSSPTATPAPRPTATPALAMPGPRVELTGMRHAWQTWNNCGPATLSMYLSFWGSSLTQEDIRLVVRPNPEDKHVGPDEMAAYARAQGLNAMVRVDGSEERLRQLLANGLPVMVSTWHEDEPGDGMGHYRLVVGYDEAAREWLLYDSLAATASDRNASYTPLRLPYDDFVDLWEVFNRRYVLVYPDASADSVHAILGEDVIDRIMWEGALAHAQRELEEDPEDPFGWFNLGTDLVALGRYEEAASAYDRARHLGLPWRMLWYQFGPFPAYYHSGRHHEVLALADATLDVTTHVEELHYWRGMALAALGDTRAARASFERALELRPAYPDAAKALAELG